MELLPGILLFWLGGAIAVVVYAQRIGRSSIWFLVALLFSPLLAGILLLALGPAPHEDDEHYDDRPRYRAPREPDADYMPCPYCAEPIRRAAILCRHCRSDLKKPAPETPPSSRPAGPTLMRSGRSGGGGFGKRALVLVPAVLLLEGCVTAEAERIRTVHGHAHVTNCALLGAVASKSELGGMFAEVGRANTLRDLRQQTADLGGDTLAVTYQSEGWIGTQTEGEAYRCGR